MFLDVYVLYVYVVVVYTLNPDLENPTYTHGVHPRPVYPNRVTIYLPTDRLEEFREVREALERDGSSVSKFFLEMLWKWWDKHKPGNPQLTLGRFETDEPQPGPGIPGSIYMRYPDGSLHWGWLHQLPFDRIMIVGQDGKPRFRGMRLEDLDVNANKGEHFRDLY